MKFKLYSLFWLSLFIQLALNTLQAQSADSVFHGATLDRIIEYAMKHQPIIQQAVLDQKITGANIKSRMADWLPQANFLYNFQHNLQLPTTIVAGAPRIFGVNNTSSVQLNFTQVLFNRDVFLAAKTAEDVRLNTQQNISSLKIDLAVNVTKAFYDVLATTQQIRVGEGDIIRLQTSLKNAYSQYEAGIADKTDYKRATITLKNTEALLKSNRENLKYKLEYLKSLMGYPGEKLLHVQYDSLQMENDITLDTLQPLDYTARIDYKLLQTQKNLQKANVRYNQWAFLPTVNAFGSVIGNFQNDSFYDVYSKKYPNTYLGATFALPVFQGGKRIANIHQQKWTLDRIDWDIVQLKNTSQAQYAQTLALYKSNLSSYQALKQNVELAREVYDIIQLQYKSGVKTFLEVITSETDLRTARINYINALYQLLASKVDVQRALGLINY